MPVKVTRHANPPSPASRTIKTFTPPAPIRNKPSGSSSGPARDLIRRAKPLGANLAGAN